MGDDGHSDSADLIDIVSKRTKSARTRSLDISLNELLDMKEKDELIIDPAYQRLFRWSEGSQSRFIESLLLELPIPPIFVIEREVGIYELVDGLQRLSSYMHFIGVHGDCKNDDGSLNKLKLTDCDIIKELNGLTYDDLPYALKVRLRRNFIRVEVIRSENDPVLRYHMFKRFNTGGERLSEQEVRNCTIRILDDKFIDFVSEMSKNTNFAECISNLPDEKIKQKYDEELVLRFFAFKNYRNKYTHDVEDFLTDYMEAIAKKREDFIYDKEREIFNKTFAVLNGCLGEFAFSGVNKQKKFISRFLSLHYECFTLGIQEYLGNIDTINITQMKKLREGLIKIKGDEEFHRLTTGGGKNYSKMLEERIEFIKSQVEPYI